MYKIIMLLLILSNMAYAKPLSEMIGIPKLAEFNLLKADVAKNADAIFKAQADIDLQLKMINNINVALTSKANVAALAGFNNQLSQVMSSTRVGRDQKINTRTTNESDLLKFIFDKIGYIIMLMFGFLGSLIAGVWKILAIQSKGFERALETKDKQITFLIDVFMKAEDKSDIATNRFIEILLQKLNGKGGENK